ncbi:PLP-dependent transferase [Phellopilus nigrolimitatus]|nr:PLP-dependent transferase [Phellopilus nigrolimitatus]
MHLYRNVRIHQIFGANTDVGKTVLGTALILASANRGKQVRYLKPVSTGPLEDADDEYVKRFSSRFAGSIQQTCLHRYKEPVSPHLALRLEHDSNSRKDHLPSDEMINKSISRYVGECAEFVSKKTDIYIETAGGVHSPSLSGISQIDSYRTLRLPIILVGDSKLGGISSTISSYESLVLRGYTVDVILLFRDDYYRNWEYLSEYFGERGVHVASFPRPPPKLKDKQANHESTDAYYTQLINEGHLDHANDYLTTQHLDRIDELHSMPKRTMDSVWWPFVQHGLVKDPKDVAVIDSAHGDFFSTYTGFTSKDSNLLSSHYDGSASWWTQAFGHAHPSIALAAARAAGRYGHVMFPQATHLPALRLAERLLSSKGPGKGWASRVFFSDDGSTAMEIALKMGLRAYCVRYGQDMNKADKEQLGVLGLKGSYHGDTIGAMDACHAADGVYTCEWHSAKGFWFDSPSVAMRDGKAIIELPSAITNYANINCSQIAGDSLPWLYDVERRLETDLAVIYRRFIEDSLRKIRKSQGAMRLAALVLEPLLMGAGGMIFVDPLFQRVLVDVVRGNDPATKSSKNAWRGLPVIFDEVFVGMYRTGSQSCISTLGVKPDIAVYAKTLTGGLVPLAVTLASECIFKAFLSDKKADALLHGHSYTAHAVGCEVANESLTMMEKMTKSEAWMTMRSEWKEPSQKVPAPAFMWSFWSPNFVKDISRLPAVNSVMTLGTVLAIKLSSATEGYRSQVAQTQLQDIQSSADGKTFGIHFRTLGDVAYFMTSFNTPPSIVKVVEGRIASALKSGFPS